MLAWSRVSCLRSDGRASLCGFALGLRGVAALPAGRAAVTVDAGEVVQLVCAAVGYGELVVYLIGLVVAADVADAAVAFVHVAFACVPVGRD